MQKDYGPMKAALSLIICISSREICDLKTKQNLSKLHQAFKFAGLKTKKY